MKFTLSLTVFLLSVPTLMYAQDKVYSPLVDLSNAGQGNEVQSFEQYINFLYGMSIAVAALLAVIKIIIAGSKYMLSDVISNKGEALEDIKGAILGLLLILSAVIILELINPQLTNRTITFPEIKGERGGLKSMALQTVAGGQTAQQYTDKLFEGVDACVQRGEPKTGQSGNTSVTVANANDCADALAQLTTFELNCKNSGGKTANGGAGSNIVTCAKTLGGIAESNAYSTDMQKKFGEGNVTTEGRITTIDIHTGCYEKFKDATSKMAYDSCISQAKTTASLTCSTKNGVYGKFEPSSDGKSVSCEMPSQIRTVDSFKGFDPNFPNSTPTTEAEFEKACKAISGTYIEDAEGDVTNWWSPENDRCITY